VNLSPTQQHKSCVECFTSLADAKRVRRETVEGKSQPGCSGIGSEIRYPVLVPISDCQSEKLKLSSPKTWNITCCTFEGVNDM
jgi:hypothetical protein